METQTTSYNLGADDTTRTGSARVRLARGASAEREAASQRRYERRLFMLVFIITLAATAAIMLGGMESPSIVPASLGGIGAVLVAGLIVWRPRLMFYVLAVTAVIIEEEPLTTGHDLTDQLPIFQWPSALAGQPERPIGYLLLLTFFVLMAGHFIRRDQILRGGKLLGPFLIFLLFVVGGVFHSLASGGDFKITIVEVRPFWYLFVSYLLAYNVVTEKRHVRAFIWIAIVGAGIKAIQGAYIVFAVFQGNLSGQRVIMAHEESFFWVVILLLLLLFKIHYPDRRQARVILLLLPIIIFSLYANNRRADYIALLLAIVFSCALIFQLKPRIRRKLAINGTIIAVVFTGYVFALGHSSSAIASPARTVMSVFDPSASDSGDASSNQYRQVEDFDTRSTAKSNPIFGIGFGTPFEQPVKLVNLLSLDPYYLYIPHNNIYWVWFRLGGLGWGAFWFLIGSIIIQGCQIARRLRDPYLQIVAIVAVSATIMEIVLAFADYQLFFYRNVIFIGLLVGILMKLPELDSAESTQDNRDSLPEGSGASPRVAHRELVRS